LKAQAQQPALLLLTKKPSGHYGIKNAFLPIHDYAREDCRESSVTLEAVIFPAPAE